MSCIKSKMQSIKRKEGTYGLEEGHFVIDCSCGNSEEEISFKDRYQQRDYNFVSFSRTHKPKNTFCMNEVVIEEWLGMGNGAVGKALEFRCGNCQREFKLTRESYQQIIEEINQTR